jgi:hypothetical protein
MPTLTGRERAANVPLKGSELRELLLKDFTRLLDGEGLLSPHLAYGRLSWRIRLTLHLDNTIMPKSESVVASRPPATNALAEHPELAAIEPPPPLADPSPDSIASDRELTRVVRSPNVERVREGLSIPVEVKGQDGTITMERIQYPPDPSLGDGEVAIAEHTRDTSVDWGLLDQVVGADEETAT